MAFGGIGIPRYHSRGCPPPRPVGTAARPPPNENGFGPGTAAAPAPPAAVESGVPPRPPPPRPPPRPPRPPAPAPPPPPRAPPAPAALPAALSAPAPPRPPRPPPAPAESATVAGVFSRPDCVSYIRIMPLWLYATEPR